MLKRDDKDDTKNNNSVVEQETKPTTYSVSETQEVYLCINATNKEHECDFGLCRDYYLKNVPTRSKRRRKTDEDDSICNHNCLPSLYQFFDKHFFAKDNMEQIKKRGITWISHCAKCKTKFISKNWKGAVL